MVSLAEPQRRLANAPLPTRVLVACVDAATSAHTLARRLNGLCLDAIFCSDEPAVVAIARHINVARKLFVETSGCLRASVSGQGNSADGVSDSPTASPTAYDELLENLADRNAHKTTLVLACKDVCSALLASVLPTVESVPSLEAGDLFLLERRAVGWRRFA